MGVGQPCIYILFRSRFTSDTLGCTDRNNSNPTNGSRGHIGGTSPGQTRKKPKDLSTPRMPHGTVWGPHVWLCGRCVVVCASLVPVLTTRLPHVRLCGEFTSQPTGGVVLNEFSTTGT